MFACKVNLKQWKRNLSFKLKMSSCICNNGKTNLRTLKLTYHREHFWYFIIWYENTRTKIYAFRNICKWCRHFFWNKITIFAINLLLKILINIESFRCLFFTETAAFEIKKYLSNKEFHEIKIFKTENCKL